jgi:hypothetical protein
MIQSGDDNMIISQIQIHHANNVINDNRSSITDKLWAFNNLQSPDKILPKINFSLLQYYNEKLIDLNNRVNHIFNDINSLRNNSSGNTSSINKDFLPIFYKTQYTVHNTSNNVKVLLDNINKNSIPKNNKDTKPVYYDISKDIQSMLFDFDGDVGNLDMKLGEVSEFQKK